LFPIEAENDRALTILVLVFRRTVHSLDTIEYLLREQGDRNGTKFFYYSDSALIIVRRLMEDFLLFKEIIDSHSNTIITQQFYDYETKELYDMYQYLIDMNLLNKKDFETNNYDTIKKYSLLSSNVKKKPSFINFKHKLENSNISLQDKKRFKAVYNLSSRALHTSPLDLNRMKDDEGFNKLAHTSATASLIFSLYIALNESRQLISIYTSLGDEEYLNKLFVKIERLILYYQDLGKSS
jgi:hypothetical protein